MRVTLIVARLRASIAITSKKADPKRRFPSSVHGSLRRARLQPSALLTFPPSLSPPTIKKEGAVDILVAGKNDPFYRKRKYGRDGRKRRERKGENGETPAYRYEMSRVVVAPSFKTLERGT